MQVEAARLIDTNSAMTDLLVIPRHYFICSGRGDGNTALNAFDRALLDAGVGDVNLMRLSSILPPHCNPIEPLSLRPGALVPVAYATITGSKAGSRIAAAIAIAVPCDRNQAALIMEYSAEGPSAAVEEKVRSMASSNMQYRGRSIDKIVSIVAEHVVQEIGCAFACVVMLP